jgi:hypothetical protein
LRNGRSHAQLICDSNRIVARSTPRELERGERSMESLGIWGWDKGKWVFMKFKA